MFKWLINALTKLESKISKQPTSVTTEQALDRYDIYQPAERLIFEFFDGSKVVKADPMRIYKRIMACGTELSTDQKLAVSPSKDAVKGHENMLKKIREIFDIKPLEEGGLTEFETAELLDSFLLYAHMIKKNSSPTTTIQEEASQPTPPPTKEAENPTTSNDSASGSTGGVPFTGQPRPWRSGRALRSEQSSQASNTTNP